MATLLSGKSIGQPVVLRSSRANVFEKFGLDYSFNGRDSLRDICVRNGNRLER
jgi:hypothetical protein